MITSSSSRTDPRLVDVAARGDVERLWLMLNDGVEPNSLKGDSDALSEVWNHADANTAALVATLLSAFGFDVSKIRWASAELMVPDARCHLLRGLFMPGECKAAGPWSEKLAATPARSLDRLDDTGKTVLMRMISEGAVKTAGDFIALFGNRILKNVADDNGDSLLMLALAAGENDLAMKLLDLGVRPFSNDAGVGPVHLSADTRLLEKLATAGADLNERGTVMPVTSMTPILLFAYHGFREAAVWCARRNPATISNLVEGGDLDGMDAVAIARARGHAELEADLMSLRHC